MKVKSERKVTQLCPTLGDPMDCSLPGSSIHGISQARILSGLTFPSPGNLPNPRIKPMSPVLADSFFTTESPGKSMCKYIAMPFVLLLLLSRFSHVRLCATPQMAAHQAPPHWDSPGKNTGVGCHFLLQCMKVKSERKVAQSREIGRASCRERV